MTDPAEEGPDLDLLVVECIERMEIEGTSVVEELCAAHPGVAAELRAAIKPLLDVGAVDPHMDSTLIPEIATANAITPNTTVAGYEILREIGRGGMGVVFEALDPRVGRRVALKVMRQSIALDDEAATRFEREAAAAGALRHPGLVQLYAAGIEGDQPWLAMEFVECAGLDQVLAELRHGAASLDDVLRDVATKEPSESDSVTSSEQALPSRTLAPRELRRRVGLVLEVAEALEEVQRHDIVHRDIKPSNIFVRPNGHAVLGDFGLARRVDEPDVTKTGAFAGTPYYASPEQAQGRSSALGPASDVFSLGVTLYELLTLRRPFKGETTRAILNEIEHVDPVDPLRLIPALPDEIVAITLKALAKDPSDRYAGAAEFAADLHAFLAFRPVSARRATGLRRLRRWIRREPMKAALVSVTAVGFLTVVGIGGYALSQRELAEAGRLEEARQEAELLTSRGFRAFLIGDHAGAAIEFKRALGLVPDDELAMIGHVVSSFRKEIGKRPSVDAALELLERYRGSNRSDDDNAGDPKLPKGTAQRLEALVHHVAEDFDSAKRILQSLGPPTTAVDFFLHNFVSTGSSAAQRGSLLDAAIRTSERPVHVFYVLRAGVCQTHGDARTASTLARTLVRQWPKEAASWIAAGTAVLRFDKKASKTFFEKALQLDSENRDSRISLLQLYKDAGDFEAADKQATDCLQRFPDEAHVHSAVARLRLKQKQMDAAERHAIRAYNLARAHRLPRIWRDSVRLASALAERQRKPDRAIEMLQESIALEPQIRDFHSDLIRFLIKHQKWRAALEVTNGAIERFRDYAIYRERRATIYEALGDRTKAALDLRACCKMDPKRMEFWLGLSLLLARDGQFDEAVRASQRAVELTKFGNAMALTCHAQNLSDGGHFDRAEYYLRIAIEVEALPGQNNPGLRESMRAAMAELKKKLR